MMYENYYFWEIHLVWWVVWVILLFQILFTTYDIPGQRKKKESLFDLLKERFASGQINKEKYQENKKLLEE
jgi:putative membrane protein